MNLESHTTVTVTNSHIFSQKKILYIVHVSNIFLMEGHFGQRGSLKYEYWSSSRSSQFVDGKTTGYVQSIQKCPISIIESTERYFRLRDSY